MKMNQVNLDALRNRARQALADSRSELSQAEVGEHLSSVEQLLEELRIYQAELEIQNQELEHSQTLLVETADKYRSTFDFLPLPALLVDSDGRIHESNRQAMAFLGLRHSFRYQAPQLLMLFVQGETRRQLAQVLLDRPSVSSLIPQVRIRVGPGVYVPCDIHVLHLSGSDTHNPPLTMVVLVDRSVEQELERRGRELIAAKEAAEAASVAKTKFLSMVSHELRTPMNGIMGMLSIAREHTEDPVLHGYLDKTDRASRHLLAVINDVLDMTRIESDQLILAAERFTPEKLREQVDDTLGARIQEKGLVFKYHQSDSLRNRTFVGDVVRLGQILINLVNNAYKFTSSGKISVSLQEVPSLTPKANVTRLRYEVLDTGMGIRLEDQKRIFEPFTQVHQTVNNTFDGTGLGLSLCRKLAEAMSGTIGVQSQLGVGSLFWVEVEVANAEIVLAKPKRSLNREALDQLRSRYCGTNVLLVEDEELSQEIARVLLENAHLKVTTANDGVEALQRVQEQHFTLVLTDLNMPQMNGIELSEALRKIPAYQTTPIIAMTANAFDEDRSHCLEAGMSDHLAKPVLPEVLYDTILRWLDDKAGHHEAEPEEEAESEE